MVHSWYKIEQGIFTRINFFVPWCKIQTRLYRLETRVVEVMSNFVEDKINSTRMNKFPLDLSSVFFGSDDPPVIISLTTVYY